MTLAKRFAMRLFPAEYAFRSLSFAADPFPSGGTMGVGGSGVGVVAHCFFLLSFEKVKF
jgi:hypothetical protein